MTLENNVFAGERHVKMSGNIDMTCAPELSRLEKRLAEPGFVVFDISNVEYVDTTFLTFLVKLRHHANKADRSSIKIVGANSRLRRIFEVTGLARLFQFESDSPKPRTKLRNTPDVSKRERLSFGA